MGDPAELRPATPADVERLLELWTALIEHHRSLDSGYPATPGLAQALGREIDRSMREPACRIWVAETDRRLVGFLFGEAEAAASGLPGGGMAWIHELWVEPDARRAGVGRALVERALSFFSERRSRRISVRVESGNREGRAFWESLEFAERAWILERRAL